MAAEAAADGAAGLEGAAVGTDVLAAGGAEAAGAGGGAGEVDPAADRGGLRPSASAASCKKEYFVKRASAPY